MCSCAHVTLLEKIQILSIGNIRTIRLLLTNAVTIVGNTESGIAGAGKTTEHILTYSKSAWTKVAFVNVYKEN